MTSVPDYKVNGFGQSQLASSKIWHTRKNLTFSRFIKTMEENMVGKDLNRSYSLFNWFPYSKVRSFIPKTTSDRF